MEELSLSMYVIERWAVITHQCDVCSHKMTEVMPCIAMRLIGTHEEVNIKLQGCTRCGSSTTILKIKDKK